MKLGAYLDREAVLLHSGVNEEEERVLEEALILGIRQQCQVVLVDAEGGLIDGRPSLIETNEAFLGVYFAMKFEHALRELRVRNDAAVLVEGKRTRETRLNVDFAAIDAPQ